MPRPYIHTAHLVRSLLYLFGNDQRAPGFQRSMLVTSEVKSGSRAPAGARQARRARPCEVGAQPARTRPARVLSRSPAIINEFTRHASFVFHPQPEENASERGATRTSRASESPATVSLALDTTQPEEKKSLRSTESQSEKKTPEHGTPKDAAMCSPVFLVYLSPESTPPTDEAAARARAPLFPSPTAPASRGG